MSQISALLERSVPTLRLSDVVCSELMPVRDHGSGWAFHYVFTLFFSFTVSDHLIIKTAETCPLGGEKLHPGRRSWWAAPDAKHGASTDWCWGIVSPSPWDCDGKPVFSDRKVLLLQVCAHHLWNLRIRLIIYWPSKIAPRDSKVRVLRVTNCGNLVTIFSLLL